MFCACSFHGNSMDNLLSYCGLIDAKTRVSDKDLPVTYDMKSDVASIYEFKASKYLDMSFSMVK
jgi:hypothetical protein